MPVLNEYTIKFDGAEATLTAKLGRRPTIAELALHYFDQEDRTGLLRNLVGIQAQAKTPFPFVYATLRTTRTAWPMNLDQLSRDERAEWDESVDRYYRLYGDVDRRPAKVKLDKAWKAAEKRMIEGLMEQMAA